MNFRKYIYIYIFFMTILYSDNLDNLTKKLGTKLDALDKSNKSNVVNNSGDKNNKSKSDSKSSIDKEKETSDKSKFDSKSSIAKETSDKSKSDSKSSIDKEKETSDKSKFGVFKFNKNNVVAKESSNNNKILEIPDYNIGLSKSVKNDNTKSHNNPFKKSGKLSYKVIPLKDVNYNFIDYQKAKKIKNGYEVRPSKKYTKKDMLIQRYNSMVRKDNTIPINPKYSLKYSNKNLDTYKYYNYKLKIYLLNTKNKNYSSFVPLTLGNVHLVSKDKVVTVLVKNLRNPLFKVNKKSLKNGMIAISGCCNIVGIYSNGELFTYKDYQKLKKGREYKGKFFNLGKNFLVKDILNKGINHFINIGSRILKVNNKTVHNFNEYANIMRFEGLKSINYYYKDKKRVLTIEELNEYNKLLKKHKKNREKIKLFNDIEVDGNLNISSIKSHSKAYNLGVLKGDHILQINGEVMYHIKDIRKYLSENKKLKVHSILIERNMFQFFVKYLLNDE